MTRRCASLDCCNWAGYEDCRVAGPEVGMGGRCRLYSPRVRHGSGSEGRGRPAEPWEPEGPAPDGTAQPITYRLEMVSCGKCRRCRQEGPSHGPYWYAYWKEDGKTRSRYIGKGEPVITYPEVGEEEAP
mgnify:CR=1 FL=1